ncbi:MAG TPA: peptide chain release factor N(5)-glutamine methyltransferase [Candidatus Acidoferrales bacterium]|nr:peptide chain release factor N(5)-glutamine methyltransferase [Candidatus Acidoferrales bacterium]
MTLQTALLQGSGLLEDAGIAVPRLTAEVLLSHALHCERVYLYAHPERELSEVEWIHYGRYLHERMQGKPTQYITKRQEFYGREFRVTPDVLIPRPETELVVEVALQAVPGARRMLDIGTGSGALAVTLQLETGAAAWATDISARAAAVAAGNAARLGAHVEVVVGDLMEAIAAGSMDLIVSNPPYVPEGQREGLQREVRDWEPHVALFAGASGFALYDRIAADAPRVLRPGGWLIMELGFGSLDHVRGLLAGWAELRITPDLAGIPRVIAARV